MKYEATASFLADYTRLTLQERALFGNAVRLINETHDQHPTTWPPPWPFTLRIRSVRDAPGIWELTWSFAGPDGRATFEFFTVDGEPAIRWRRIGGHEVFRAP